MRRQFYCNKKFLTSILHGCFGNCRFFSNRVVEPWNSLPAEPHHSSSLSAFKTLLKSVDFQGLCNSRTILHCRSLDTCRLRCMFLTFFLFYFSIFPLVGACKSYFVALVLLSLHFVVKKESQVIKNSLVMSPHWRYSATEARRQR